MNKTAGGEDGTATSVVLSMATMVAGEMGGSETYARALVAALSRRSDVDVRLLLPKGASGFDSQARRRFTEVSPGSTAPQRLATLARLIATRGYASLMRDASVIHYPFTVPAPPPAGRPWVTTLLDVQHLDLPGMFSSAEKAYRAALYDAAAKRADVVVTISSHAKSRMIETLGLVPERVHVAHLGVDSARFVFNRGPREDFVLYPARGWPHKNHAMLVEAMKIVRRRRPLSLVLTGGGLASLGRLPEWVQVRGLVSEDELRDLYGRAACLAFPSLYEGFGLPPLEAMASGCPVAASRIPVIAEVCGDAAELFYPGDPEAIAAAILAAVERYPTQGEAGASRVAAFTWERCAAAHVAAYRQASGDR